MSREQSDGEDSAGETRTDRFVDATAEMEVELRLPLEVDMEPAQIRKDVPINSELSIGMLLILIRKRSADSDPQTGPNRSGPDTGLRRYPALHRQLPGSGAQPVGFRDGRRKFGMSSPVYPGQAQRRPNAEIQQVKLTPNRFAFGLPTPAFRHCTTPPDT